MTKILTLTIISFLFLTGMNSIAQGEACGTATSVAPDGTCHTTSTVGASDDVPNEVGCATIGGQNGHRDQWFSFVATDSQFDINVTNSAPPTNVPNNNIEVLLLSSTGPCTGLALAFSTCGNLPLTDQFAGLIPGNTYYVVVSTPQGGGNDGVFDVCIDNSTPATPPPNDDCTGAIAVPTDGTCTTGTNIAANDSWTGEPGCATNGPSAQHLDVWYSFVATAGVVDITATDLTIGGELEVVLVESQGTPCVDAWTLLDSYCGTSPVTGTFAGLTPGNTYYYTVSSNNLQEGDFETCVTDYNITNDDCTGAINIPVGTNGICNIIEGTNVGATPTAGVPAPSCGFYAGGDVWFSIIVPPSGEVTFGADFATSNSLTDIDMELYTGSCGSLTSIGCDDNSGTGSMPDLQMTGLTPGATIFIRVWDNGNLFSGSFDLCISEPPVILTNQDCIDALPICSDANFGGASNGSGAVNDLYTANDDCLFGENQTSWLYLEISSPGDFMFTISPDNGTDDYDFALWHYPGGTGQACPPPDNSVDRCSWGASAGYAGSYDTGLDDGTFVTGGPGDVSEGASGDNWVDEIAVATGDAIMLVIDNYSSTTSPYTLDFTGTAGLDCTILPSEFMTFYAEANGRNNDIHWVTTSETNNSYFTIQHSFDGETWETIAIEAGAGMSTEKKYYSTTHENVRQVVNYYRMFQTDFDGTQGDYKNISINNAFSSSKVVITTNLIGQEVDENYKGIVLDILEDGTSVKRLQQ